MIYKRVNKQTREVVTGRFEEICDLDKRLWSELESIEEPVIVVVRIETSLCKLFNDFFNFDYLRHEVRDLRDLVGYHF